MTWVGKLPNGGKFTIKESETIDIHAKNTFEYSKGGFSILKTVGGDAADLSTFKSKQYEFTYVCEQPNGQQVKGTISATPGKSVVVKDILVGSKCEVTETQSVYPNVDWLVELSGEGVEAEGNKARFKIADHNKPSVNLKAKNTFTQYKGGFSIEKTVAAEEGIKTPQEFDFTWTCGNVNGEVKVPVKNGKGSVDVSEEIPVGTSCVVAEKDAKVAGTELVTEWKNQRFTIGKQSEIVQVSAKNIYKHETGAFLIEKQIIGGARDKALDKTFTFNYVCTKDGKEIRKASTQIKGEGSSELIDALPVGAECRIEEQDAKISGTRWKHTISEHGKFKISSTNVIYQITVVNGYESPNFLSILPLIPLIPLIPFIVGPPQPPVITPVAPIIKNPPNEKPREQKTAPKRDKPSLARTGANTLGIAFAAVLLVGIGLLLVRRNRRSSITSQERTEEAGN
ncbi:LPXTG cell wall anchor domain-containing protein [Corynebacterium ulcerans]|nr:LPXTG cell wall anchor domain-containing protein [Corynebacterium silvaticum]